MQIKFTYPAKSSLVLADFWPVTVADIRLEWAINEGRVAAIIATVPVRETDRLPTMQPSVTPGVVLDVNLGWNSRENEVEEAVRTLWGLLGLFCYLEIDIGAVETEWIPENDSEREALKVYSYSHSVQKKDLLEPRRLGYDIVARAMASAKTGTHYEIPLGFLRRGTRAIYNEQYIDAFYNLFFFLETLFAPGYSNPKVVKQRLCRSQAVKVAVTKSQEPFSKERHLDTRKRDELLRMSDDQLIHHLVDLRGELHHHSLGKPGIWHPEKASHFREEAILLQHVVHSIALANTLELLYAPERNDDLMSSATMASAIAKLRVEASGVINGVKTRLQPYLISVPGRRVDAATIDGVHRHFRSQFPGGPQNVEVTDYKIMSEDASQVYAIWERAASSI